MLVFVPRDGALLGERLVALITRVDCRRSRRGGRPPARRTQQRRLGGRREARHRGLDRVRVGGGGGGAQVLDDLGQGKGSVGQHLRRRHRLGRQQRLRAQRHLGGGGMRKWLPELEQII